MRINLHASGFDLTNHTPDFVQSKLLYRRGQSTDRRALALVRDERSFASAA
jgi:hypothetical protein